MRTRRLTLLLLDWCCEVNREIVDSFLLMLRNTVSRTVGSEKEERKIQTICQCQRETTHEYQFSLLTEINQNKV